LHIAASEGTFEAVKCLLKLGALVHARDRFKRTPLRNALFFGHEAIVKLLVSAGAHFSEWEMKDVTNELVKWILLGDVFRVKLWILSGADINRPWIDGRKPSEMVWTFLNITASKIHVPRYHNLIKLK
jgi:ankyrin repeat protein